MKKIPITLALALAIIVQSASAAITLSVTEAATVNSYGRTSGIAIDFNTNTSEVSWTGDETNLTAGNDYNVDSVGLYLNDWTPTGNYYLGVYTSLTTDGPGGSDADTLGGFLGTSTNAIDLANAGPNARDLVTWNFDDIVVTADSTAGSGSGVLYFMIQSGTTALSDAGAQPAAGEQSFHRIDGTTNTFSDFLSATISGSQNVDDQVSDLITDRPLEFQASVTPVPEPSTYALLAGIFALMSIMVRRRR